MTTDLTSEDRKELRQTSEGRAAIALINELTESLRKTHLLLAECQPWMPPAHLCEVSLKLDNYLSRGLINNE